MPVECVAQIAVSREAATQRVVDIDSHIGVAGVAVEAVGGAVCRLHVEHRTAKIAGHIRRHLAAGKRRHHGARIRRPAKQFLAGLERRWREIRRPVERKNFGLQARVPAGDEDPSRRPQLGLELRALCPRVGDVIRLIKTQLRERAAQRHNQIVETVVEVSPVQRQPVVEESLLHAGVEAARPLGLESGVVGVRQVESRRRPDSRPQGRMPAGPAQHIRRGQLGIGRRNGLRREERSREAVRRDGRRVDELAAHARTQKQPSAQFPAVLEVYRGVAPADGKRLIIGVRDVAVLDLFQTVAHAHCGGVVARNAHDRARLALRAEVAIEGKSVRALVPVVIQKKRPEQFLADASPQIRLVVRQVIRRVVLAAADGVDAGERMLRVGAPRAGLANLVGIEIAVQRKHLPPEVPHDIQQQVFIVIVAVGDGAVRVQARRRGRDPKTRQPAGARNAEAAFVVAATLRQDVDGGRRVRLARHKVDHAAVGVWPVDGRLRAADHLHAVQRLGGNVREIEIAAEGIHRHAIDLHQVESRISAADEQPGQAPGGPRLAEDQARHLAQQVDR